MIIAYILEAISIIICLIIPFRQFKGSYFLYFLILAFQDPITYVVIKLFDVHPFRPYVVIFLFLIYSIMNPAKLRKRIPILIIITSAGIILAVISNVIYLRLIVFLEGLPILYIFLNKTIIDITKNNRINIFYMVINFDNLILLVKNFVLLIDFKTGIYYFYLTSALGIIVSLYYVFYNDKNAYCYYLKI